MQYQINVKNYVCQSIIFQYQINVKNLGVSNNIFLKDKSSSTKKAFTTAIEICKEEDFGLRK